MAINIGYPSGWQHTSQVTPSDNQSKVTKSNSTEGVDFRSVFERKSIEELTFSRHANNRLESRNIDLSPEQLTRLNNAARMAQEKGIKESLVMLDDLAFIVNIPNNTVVTALGDGDGKIITNIDGAVIV